eukprot:3938858-Amphidinium_carterae.1
MQSGSKTWAKARSGVLHGNAGKRKTNNNCVLHSKKLEVIFNKKTLRLLKCYEWYRARFIPPTSTYY